MDKSIAIIGAGVSGLAAAWGLRDCPDRVVLYDKGDKIGGNCQSRWVAVGDQYRFCDLGVNDFNTRAYADVVNPGNEVKTILDDEIAGRTQTRYMLWDANTHEAIKWDFPHNVLDLDGMDAQTRLDAYQGQNRLYFTGGWSYGSGLHEECWQQSQAVARAARSGATFSTPGLAGAAPPHIVRALEPR